MTSPEQRIGLRPLADDDGDFLFAVFVAVRGGPFREANLPEAQITQLLEMQYEGQRRHYAAHYPSARTEIVTVDERPIGYLNVAREAGRFVLVDVALLPEHRGGGIGTRLLTALCQEADAAGQPLVAHVETTNPARRLYRRLGFEELSDDGAYVEILRRPGAGA